jgi:WD40 repeat protein
VISVDLKTAFERSAELGDRETTVTAVALTPNGSEVIAGADNFVKVLSSVDFAFEHGTLSGHSGSVEWITVTPDGHRAVSADYRDLRVWDLRRKKEILTLSGHLSWIRSMAATRDCRRAILGFEDSKVKVWDLEKGTEISTLSGHKGRVTSVALTSDGAGALSSSADRTVRIWDVVGGQEIARFTGEHLISCCAILPDNRTFLAGDAAGRLLYLRLETPHNVRK